MSAFPAAASSGAQASGWYPDPDGRPHQRWYDGSDWTDQLAPSGSNPPRLSVVGDAPFAPAPALASGYVSPAPMPTMLATAPPPVATAGQYGIGSLPEFAPDAPADAPSYGVQTSSAFQTGLGSVPPVDGPPALPGLAALPALAAAQNVSTAPPLTPAFPSLTNLPGPNVAGALPAADVRLALAPNAPYLDPTAPQTGTGYATTTAYQAAPEVTATPVAPQAHRPVVQGHSGVATPPSGTPLSSTNRPRAQRALDIATQSSALGIAYDRADYGAASPLSTEEEVSDAASRAATLAAFASGLNTGLFAPAAPAAAPAFSAPAAPVHAPAPARTALRPSQSPAAAPAPAAISAPTALALVPAYRVPETAAFVPPVQTTPLSSSYQPFAMIPDVRTGTELAPTRTYTASAWLIAVLPLLIVGVGLGIVLFSPEFYSRFAQVGIIAVATLVAFALAARDRAELLKAGHARAASAAWMILTPIGYFIARLARTSRQSKGGAWPLIAFVAIIAASAFGIAQLPEWAPALLLTPAG